MTELDFFFNPLWNTKHDITGRITNRSVWNIQLNAKKFNMNGDTANLDCVTVLERPANVLLTIKILSVHSSSQPSATKQGDMQPAIRFICSQAAAAWMTRWAAQKAEPLRKETLSKCDEITTYILIKAYLSVVSRQRIHVDLNNAGGRMCYGSTDTSVVYKVTTKVVGRLFRKTEVVQTLWRSTTGRHLLFPVFDSEFTVWEDWFVFDRAVWLNKG